MWLTGEMKVLNTTALGDTTAAATYGDSGFTGNLKANATTDDDLKALNLTGYKTVSNVNYYYKQLSVAQTTNPQTDGENNQKDGYLYDGVRGTNTTTDGSSPSTPNSSAYSEVQTIQAGGYLVSAPADAEYEFVTNQETRLPLYFDTTNTAVNINVPGGYLVKVVTTSNASASGTIGTDGSVSLDKTATAVRGATAVPTVYVLAQSTFSPVKVDAETFAPVTAGTYIFARNVDQKLDTDTNVVMTANNLDDYEFTGYYFDAIADNGTTAGKGGYWALKNADARGTNRSDYTLPKNYTVKIGEGTATDKLDSGYGTGTGAYTTKVLNVNFDDSGNLFSVTPTTDLELYTATYKQIENSALKWVYTAPASGEETATLSAIYQGDTTLVQTDTGDTAKAKLRDDIVVDIKLNNIAATTDKWSVFSGTATKEYYYGTDKITNGVYDTSAAPTQLDTNALWTFYYNNDVEAGDTTAKLVDSVTLRNTTQKEAFIAFDFDLNVNLESIQVAVDEAGKEMVTPVTPWNATTISSAAVNTGATTTSTNGYVADANYTGNELNVAAWTAITTP